MREYLKNRPWLWIIAALAFIVLLDAILVYVAATTQGDELKPLPEQEQSVAGRQAPP